MSDQLGTKLLDGASVATTGALHKFSPGIYNVQVEGDLGAATVQIAKTLNGGNAATAVDETDLLFTSSATFNVVRGGAFLEATLTGTPITPITVWVAKASE